MKKLLIIFALLFGTLAFAEDSQMGENSADASDVDCTDIKNTGREPGKESGDQEAEGSGDDSTAEDKG